MDIKERILEKLEQLRPEQLKALELELEEWLQDSTEFTPSSELPEMPRAKLRLIPGVHKPKLGLPANQRPVVSAGAKTTEELLAEMREGR